jgi:hypothetical protein
VIAKKATSRKKKELDFLGEGMVFNRHCQQCPDYATIAPAKIMVGRKALSQGALWNEKKFRTPVDKGFNVTQFKKFYSKQSVLLLFPSDKVASDKQAERLSDVMEYDYNNDNDTSYCPNSQADNVNSYFILNFINRSRFFYILFKEQNWDECNKEDDAYNQSRVLNGLEMVEPPPKVILEFYCSKIFLFRYDYRV